jgi:hypothetical protein
MVGKDKHPPRNWSTNKVVKAPTGGAKMGTAVKTANTAKMVRPGDGVKTSAKTVGATMSQNQAKRARTALKDEMTYGQVKREQKKTGTITGGTARAAQKQLRSGRNT